MTPVSSCKLFAPFLAVMLVTASVPQASPVMAEPLTQQRQSELINTLKHDCGSCHGLTLKGGLGPPLTRAALTDKPFDLLFNTILLGRENTAMPPWDGLLTKQEINWLVVQLKNGIDEAQEHRDE
ncbi:MAG: c-type cytochrome c55x [Gammaproteobacteria bacterium]|nr:c-type cytochrome c55x [Gammaproteobacteria bacterium]